MADCTLVTSTISAASSSRPASSSPASSMVQWPMNAALTTLDGLSNSVLSERFTVRPVAGEDAIPTIASMTFEVNTVSMSGGKT